MRKLFKQYSSRKTPAPDNVSTSTLKHCADELAPVFTDVFNASLNLHPLPFYLKAATIIPLPKKPKPKALNDFRPVALTSVVMKFLERLDLTYLKSVTNFSMDSFQFAICTHHVRRLHICTQHVRRLQFRLQHGHSSETS